MIVYMLECHSPKSSHPLQFLVKVLAVLLRECYILWQFNKIVHVYNPKRYGHFQHMAFCIFHMISNPRVRNRMTSLKCILIQY